MKVYHFARIENGVPVMRDGTPIKIGKKYTLNPDEIEMCEWGFHGSVDPLDALMYARGNYISIRELSGKIIKGGDKVVASECMHVAGFDGEEMLRKFARLCALDVVRLWGAPDIVIQYLITGDKALRAASLAAARAVVRENAAGAAALAAERAAAWTAARTAARAAAWAASLAASLAAAEDAWAACADLRKKHYRRLKKMIDYRIKQMEEKT
jgi:hypothetical protein